MYNKIVYFAFCVEGVIKTKNVHFIIFLNNLFIFVLGLVEKSFAPLVVVLVGLPARGKTVLAHKLKQYLLWKGNFVKGMDSFIFLKIQTK